MTKPKSGTPKTATTKVTKNPTIKSSLADASTHAKPRRLKSPTYKRFRLSKRIKHPANLPGAWQLARKAGLVLWQNWKLFLGITVVYTLLTILLVRGFSGGTNIDSFKSLLGSGIDGQVGKLASSLTVFALLVTSSGNSSSQVAGVYQTFLAIIGSLAVIWALRQVLAGNVKARVRDAFYQGMYPLVPVLLVLMVIGLQLLPMLIGTGLYSLVVRSGVAAAPIEQILWALLALILSLVSLYLLASSIFALYIAALPDMTPMKALRSARELVRYRRWTILRKLVFLPFILLLGAMVVLLPIIWLITPLAAWAFFLLTMIGLPAIHAYMYTLYRELLV